MVKGRYAYLPKDVVDELEKLKMELPELNKDGSLLRRMAFRSDIFRELKYNLNGKKK